METFAALIVIIAYEAEVVAEEENKVRHEPQEK